MSKTHLFLKARETIRALDAIDEAADAKLIQALASALAHRDAKLEPADYEASAFVMVKAIGALLWFALDPEKPFWQRLVVATKRLALQYLQHYFSPERIPTSNPTRAN